MVDSSLASFDSAVACTVGAAEVVAATSLA